MVARVNTVAFQGIEGVPVEVQVMVAPGKVGIQIVGLPDKAVAESRERVQAALHASGLALPAKKSPSISRLPICPRKDRISIFPLRLASWPL